VALQELTVTLQREDIMGRVIIVPAFNYLTYCAGTRTSPIDKGNMNRSFPGRPDGTSTEKVVDYFQRVLVPMADVVFGPCCIDRRLAGTDAVCSHQDVVNAAQVQRRSP
jgi:predicted deacylase